ncbi:MAG: hypothetical protein MUQ32_17165 [Chloroflexi bacterium]|nr:hypothetical protein [Chloroflexota bacterium]
MPLWRCPHCGTPQVESSRCWVCRRSTTSCAACRHFRRGVASGLGVCGLDPRRLALRGTEMRACWEAADTTGSLGPAAPGPGSPVMIPVMAAASFSAERQVRTFVPVVTGEPAADGQSAGFPVLTASEDDTPAPTVRPRRIPGYWSLWGDFEP